MGKRKNGKYISHSGTGKGFWVFLGVITLGGVAAANRGVVVGRSISSPENSSAGKKTTHPPHKPNHQQTKGTSIGKGRGWVCERGGDRSLLASLD